MPARGAADTANAIGVDAPPRRMVTHESNRPFYVFDLGRVLVERSGSMVHREHRVARFDQRMSEDLDLAARLLLRRVRG